MFFGSSDEGDNESVASDKKQDIINLIKVLNEDETLAKVSIYTGGYGGTMNMIAGCFQKKLNNEIKKEIVGVVSEIYGTREDDNELQDDDPNKISKHNDRLVWTNSLQERTEILIESAPNIIVLPGKQGTLIEFLLADENARLTYNTNKTITKHFFLDEFWRDTLFQSHFIRKSYHVNSKEKPKQHFFIDEDSDCWSNFIYDFDEQDLISYNDIHTTGDTDLRSLYTEISKKLEGLNNWKYCIEGLDFAYTIKTGDKIEESKFSNIGNKDYNQSTEEFLKGQSIIRSYIEDNLVSYCVYSNYKNDNTPIVSELEFNDPKDIPLNALRNKKVRFEDWADYLRTKEIGSSTIFLFEKFETNSLVINSGYEMYYSLFVTLNVNVTPKIFDFIKGTLKEFLFRVSNSKSIEIFQRKEKSLRNTSLKSSLAAVMSRNMSHNIGSHVLNKLSSAAAINAFFKLRSSKRFVKGIEIDNDNPSNTRKKFKFPNPELSKNPDDELRNLKDIEEDSNIDISVDEYNKILKDYPDYLERFRFSTFEKEKDIYKLSPFFVDVNNNTTKEELARVFNDYLKKRMDFVADVATSNKALLNSNKYLFADIFRGFERNLLLLHNISGKEDKFSYQFQFQYCDGSRDKKGNLITHNYYHYKKDEKNEKLILDLHDNGIPKKNNDFIDPIVAVPNDVLGSQAFYIILENIIRNTAKHSGSGNVIFTIKVEDLKEDDFYRITVFDNAPHTDIKKLVADRNVSIAQEVLDENNQIRTAGWGTIEIKLAACYLSGLDMLEMDNKTYWPIGYRAYTEAKEEVEKKVKNADELEKIKKDCGDNWVSEERYVEQIAKQAYINFLGEDDPILNDNASYPVDLPQAKKRVYSKDNKVVRYPIVQAVDGNEKDKTSGFGYSFLMKKPKKLLIIDENEHLKLDTTDEKGNVTSHKDNLIALKRLGIDIIKAPNLDSIYNHQFMIIVGDGQIKEITEDKNGKKIVPYYGDWFNLPQERLLYLNGKTYKNFIYNLKSNFFQIINNSFEDNTLISCLKFVLGESVKRKYQVLDRFLELRNNAFIHQRDELNLEVLLPDTIRPFDFGYPKSENKSNALFRHHGLQEKVFYNENTKYAEIYGSVTQLGLLAESIENQFKGKGKDIKASLKKEYKNFYEIAANSSVIVIDERIQSSLNEIGCTTESIKIKDGENEITEDGYQILNKDIFLKTKIYVPNKDVDSVDLNCSDLKTQKKTLELYIKEISGKVEADYMIIHFGIIEGLRETSKNESVNTILEEIKDWLKSDKCKIVITSGRGYTPDIKSLNQYFVAYSTISNLLLDPNGRSKGHLMQCLKQLRKLKN